ncbi:DUF2288 family protein [Hahella sp. KA22]|uniref:DUF2288 domain-containing protein n=1 Tax=Hahella sp. KA22 TaxID=1628392 RepID=UPI000FDE998B|nr:DUF2288 domain-containing protein [Hahella sp. KA22]AZZ91081.1 DUF2288 domain-containing protein [Hahella sp. KA22]QAY54451.1 DUF2288 family protein [Hahella sp. KA22]
MTEINNAGEPLSPADELRAKLVSDTARINWRELERFYAKGQVVLVSTELDLIETAAAVAQDDKQKVEAWIKSGELGGVTAETAQRWHDESYELWAVVVAPWVLVQDKPA